ncbi:Beta-lactamase enzyme family protein [Nonomuraea solani]|uniref:Beta-lactamase enzyme family protein n=1 Tax=Nonomuraea solani TaxID=1144553 RepID=A0A1H6E5Q7_9ACTN|nr:serine hydrolase [Nonomuraea solani]SEG93022.1 Beta-lactamase enzyme family protein [Nonomuraea solani]
MRTVPKPARILAAAAVAVTMTACVGRPAPVQATAITAFGTDIPGTPAGGQLRWLLDAAPRAPIPASELGEHFTADFLKNIPADQLNQVLAVFKDMKLVRLTQQQDRSLVARIAVGTLPYDLSLTVDGTGRISGLRFQSPTPRSWAELDERLGKAAPRTGLLTAEPAKDGTCRPLHAVAAGKARPLGSMFKLYVLGAVAERIKSGAFGWDTQLTITPELKSLPSGELQDRPDNSKVTVLEAAKLMISISDNTATDLLVHKAGRAAVERTMRAWGAADERNVPSLTTRELFVLKGADYPKHAKRYLSLSDGRQRAYLKSVVAKVPLSQVKAWTAPRELDTIEWFASPAQICRAYTGLVKLGDKRIAEAMSINDAGLGLDKGTWPEVWFKGGSEPGLIDMSFLARTAGGKTYVTTVMAVNPKTPFADPHATTELLSLARGAFTLAGDS